MSQKETIENEHIVEQTSPVEWKSATRDAKLWIIFLMYIPATTALILLLFGLWQILAIECVAVIMLASFIYNALSEKKRQESKGQYADSRTHIGPYEIIEQMKIDDIITEAKPGNPYPYHEVVTDEEDVLPLLEHIGVQHIYGDPDTVRKKIEDKVRAAVEKEYEKKYKKQRERESELEVLRKEIQKRDAENNEIHWSESNDAKRKGDEVSD